MIHAIIFDCYGVLVRDGWLPFCERHFGNNASLMEQAHSLSHAMNRGYISVQEYIDELAVMTNSDAGDVAAEINRNALNSQLFEWIRTVKPQYKLGILSNAGENVLEKLLGADNVALFDATVLSYEVGAAKPDAQMYEAVMRKLGVSADECVFVDDQQQYCEGARAVGMEAVLYTDNIQLKDALKKHNIFLQNA